MHGHEGEKREYSCAKGAENVTHQHDPTTTGPETPSQIFHPRFAGFYEWNARLGSERRLTDPLRQETAGQRMEWSWRWERGPG